MDNVNENHKVFGSWILVVPARDLPGTWVANYVSFDIVSQGPSPHEAAEAALEAAMMCIAEDLNEQLDPRVVRQEAPPDVMKILSYVLDHGQAVKKTDALFPPGDLRPDEFAFARYAELAFAQRERVVSAESEPRPDVMLMSAVHP